MPGVHEVAKATNLKNENVEDVFEEILNQISQGNEVRIKNFGVFSRKKFAGRTIISPAVEGGKPVTYPDSYVLKLHQSQTAKRRLNVNSKKAAAGEQLVKTEKPAKKKAAVTAEEAVPPAPPPKKAKAKSATIPPPAPKKSVPPPPKKKKAAPIEEEE